MYNIKIKFIYIKNYKNYLWSFLTSAKAIVHMTCLSAMRAGKCTERARTSCRHLDIRLSMYMINLLISFISVSV